MRRRSFSMFQNARKQKRFELQRRIAIERLKLRQMLSADNQPPNVSSGNTGVAYWAG